MLLRRPSYLFTQPSPLKSTDFLCLEQWSHLSDETLVKGNQTFWSVAMFKIRVLRSKSTTLTSAFTSISTTNLEMSLSLSFWIIRSISLSLLFTGLSVENFDWSKGFEKCRWPIAEKCGYCKKVLGTGRAIGVRSNVDWTAAKGRRLCSLVSRCRSSLQGHEMSPLFRKVDFWSSDEV